jgi:two-component system cell cycle sensor histidine kinase/response regulator CckA
MPKGGKIIIRTRNFVSAEAFKCTCDICPAGEYVLIEVEDTGAGIKPEIIQNIFEPFFSYKTEESIEEETKASGTGLGLSTVYGIVQQTGGSVNVLSKVGSGSTFQIFLPKYMGTEHVAVKVETVSYDLSGSETILFVEDEEAVRIFAARALREKGYNVVEASCGTEAIEIVSSKNVRFDLLITDVVMPKIDGPTLNKQLRSRNKNFKTIFISGYAEDTFRKELDKNCDIHFLQKPFTLKDLAKKVKEVLSI